jgi:hypothetical protein
MENSFYVLKLKKKNNEKLKAALLLASLQKFDGLCLSIRVIITEYFDKYILIRIVFDSIDPCD